MPRVTYQTYRNRHLILRQLWAEQRGVFTLLSPGQQWVLHDYYLCAQKMTEQTLRKHYNQLKTEQPSLPHRAGKAYAQLDRELMAMRPVPNRPAARGNRRVKAAQMRSLAHPKPDVDLFVRALLKAVREEEAANEQGESLRSSDPKDSESGHQQQ